MNLPKETAELLEAYFAGDPSPELMQAIEDWLRKDKANARILAEYGLIDRLIAHEQKNQDASAIFAALLDAEDHAEPDFSLLRAPAFDAELPKTDENQVTFQDLCSVAGYLTVKALRTRAAAYSSIAAMLLLGIALYLATLGPSQTPDTQDFTNNTPTQNKPAASTQSTPRGSNPQPVATITNTHNAQWGRPASAGTEHPPTTGSPLHPNTRLTLTAGFAEITTARGAIAIIQAPATIELLKKNALHLHTGKLVGICETDSSKGFVVKTDYAVITDLGTEFGVEVTDQQVAATVFTGKIEVATPGGEPQQLSADQTARLLIQGNNRDLVIDNRVATGFDALRLIPDTYSVRLPGTGEGLEQDTHDPGWRITAIDGQALDSPLPLRVSGYTAGDPDPLMPSAMLAYNPTHGRADTVYRVETNLLLPDIVAPERVQVFVRFRMDNELISLQVNGQDVPVPEQNTAIYGRDYTMIIQGPLRPGDNHIAFEVENEGWNTQQNPVGIQVRWELQPVSAEPQNQPALN